ncbi:MAG: portal protein, partial [Planctomycetota bacterium]
MPERMDAKNFSRWRERLTFAKQTWVERGLIGTQYPSPMRMLIEFYRNNQWQHLGSWAGLSNDDLMVVNKVFPIANTIDGEVAARRPQVQFRARNEDSARLVRPAEILINYDLEELNWKRQANRALRDHLFAPVGLLRHGFTPGEEFEASVGRSDRLRRLQRYRPAKPDRPWVRREPIWNVLMDPSATFFHPDEGMRWIAFREIMLLDDIKANPGMINRDDLDKVAGNVDPQWAPRPTGRLSNDDPDQDQYVEVWTVYEQTEHTWFQMTLDGLDKPLRERDDWPIPWETLPISTFQVNEQMDTPFPLSIMENVIPTAVELNKLRTIMHRIALATRRLLAVQESMDEAEKDKIANSELVEMIETKGPPGEAIAQYAVANFPADLLAYEAIIQEDLREIAGQSKMGRGQR